VGWEEAYAIKKTGKREKAVPTRKVARACLQRRRCESKGEGEQQRKKVFLRDQAARAGKEQGSAKESFIQIKNVCGKNEKS